MAESIKLLRLAAENAKANKIAAINIQKEFLSIPESIDYVGSERLEIQRLSLHNGQRKLFNSLLLFMTEYHKESNNVIYIGAAPGFNIAVVAKFFPLHTFYLYDAVDISYNQFPSNVKVQEKEFVDQNTQFPVHDSDCLFFSDIRSDQLMDKERSVEKDQEVQLEIMRKLKPKAFCLKFRIPFYMETDDNKIVKTTIYNYLKGIIFIQAYAPQQSTETRLMCRYTEDIIDYDLKSYENRMFFVNNVLREFQQFPLIGRDVEGGDQCYDCAMEEAICNYYLKSYHPLPQGLQEEITLRIGTDINVSSIRNYVNSSHSSLDLRSHPHKIYLRNPLNVIKEVDLLEVISNIYQKWICFDPVVTSKEIKYWISRNNLSNMIKSAFTHESVDDRNNYEQLEFVGDGILNGETKCYIYNNFITPSGGIHSYSTLYNYLAGKTFRSEDLEDRLGLSKYLSIAHNGLLTDEVKDDLVEAFFGLTRYLFDINILEGAGMKVIQRMVTKLLDSVDIMTLQNKIQSKKTILKETLDANYPKYGFGKLYDVTKSEGNKINVKVRAIDNNQIIEIEDFSTTTISQTKAEEEASERALLKLKAMGIMYIPKKIEYSRRQNKISRPKPLDKSIFICEQCVLKVQKEIK
jgi:dsRNA-specific ribonuclease